MTCSTRLYADDQTSPPTSPKTGDFETTFTHRSPLSNYKSLLARFSLDPKTAQPDYDLSKQPFNVYVPPNYDPRKPYGLVVLLLYKEAIEAPGPLLQYFADSNLIFVSPSHGFALPVLEQGGLVMDAVYNLKKQYNIDSRRVYLLNHTVKSDCPRTLMATSDAFTGDISVNCFLYYGPMTFQKEGLTYTYEKDFSPPPAPWFDTAKNLPYVYVDEEGTDTFHEGLVAASLKKDGFKHVFGVKTPHPDLHYPNYQLPWFKKSIDYLDSVALAPDSSQTVATAPTEIQKTDENKLAAVASQAATPPGATTAKTGDFETTFAQRSPLSEYKGLLKRFRADAKTAEPDYDLSQQPFRVCVPDNYDPNTPYGLVVLLLYKEATSGPGLLKQYLADSHIVFCSPRHGSSVPIWEQGGLAMDAAHNLKQQYKIDDKRVYIIATKDCQLVSMATSDVFTGGIWFWDYGFFSPIPFQKDGGTFIYPPDATAPPNPWANLAKAHPYVCAKNTDYDPVYSPLAMAALKRYGFDHLLEFPVSTEEYHYPNFQVAWFKKSIEYLDSIVLTAGKPVPAAAAPQPIKKPDQPEAPAVPATPAPADASSAPPASAPPPADQPATKPALDEPQRLLKLAQAYIDSQRPDLAKEKLQEILDKYPDDPAAEQAKTLMTQINQQ
ncbi:MAG: hypothetical protein M3O30_09405 [Planctomycetota bacterium]|nr:hypothetical protein [Planctomycetota bacterium]